ncbi:hypothetical protein WJX81_004957 [Elliptochloris bilobata]|uniref:ATP-dependent DNA helicase n=1 Tax=Elliptochloris bilobata TaxID=381761 RepID=A0AAW1R9U4_9CHLO
MLIKAWTSAASTRPPHQSAAYMPLHFSLLFPRGEPGWHPGILRGDAPAVMAGDRGAAPDQRTTVTPKEFAAFHVHARPAGIGSDHLLRGTRLLQEYIIDSYCVMEGNNLRYLQNHQRDIRAECYQGLLLKDLMHSAAPFGGKVVLLGGDFRQGFSELLLRIGEGREPTLAGVHTIRLPADMAAPAATLEELADWLYGTNPIGLIGGAAAGRMLLTPRVADAHALNDMILARAPGEAIVSLSADCCERDDDSALYATEFELAVALRPAAAQAGA